MKKFYLIILTFLFLQICIYSQWINIPYGGPAVNNSDAVNEQIYWCCYNTTTGTCCTTDGGQTWTSSTFVDPKGVPVYCIDAINADTAYAVTSEIFKTTNRGNTWVKQITNFSTGFANCIYFFDVNNGVATGDPNGGYFEIYTTTNGGDNWVRVPSINIPDPLPGEMGIVSSFSAYNNTFWFATFGAVSGQRIIRSTDRGYTWTLLTTFPIPSNITPTIEFRDSLHGIFIGNSYLIIKTSDGGMTWAADSLPNDFFSTSEYNLGTPAYIPGTASTWAVTAVGYSGTELKYFSLISKDDGNTWKKMDSWQYGGGWMLEQYWTSPTYGWMCLPDKGIFKWPGYTGKHIWRAGNSIKYKSIALGTPGDTFGISIGNYGTLPTTITDFNLSSNNFSLINPPALPIVVQPWDAIDMDIAFTPQVRGLFSDSLVITSDAENYSSLSVELTGKALEFTPPLPDLIYSASDSLYTFSLSNLTASSVGWFEGPQIQGLTIRPADSVLIGISPGGNSSTLYRIDPIIGCCIPIDTIPVGMIRAIAYSNTGTLYAGAKNGNLYTINTSTGEAILIGNTAGANYYSLSFNPQDGKLYASAVSTSSKDKIYTVDTLTGTATLLGHAGGGKAIPSIAFNSDGTLYGLKGLGLETNQLISISKTDGAGTEIGSLGKSGLQAIIMRNVLTDVKENNESTGLTSYELFQNYPNPWNPSTTIGYTLKEKIQVKLTMLNVLGEELSVLVNEEQDKGYHKVDFNGSKLSSGVYFYRLQAGSFVQTKKTILLK